MCDTFSLHNNSVKSTQLDNSKSTPLVLSAQLCRRNKYVSSKQITELAIELYKTKGGRGIAYTDLLETGLAVHKSQAQNMLKYHVRTGTLFILEDRRPQQYYPTLIKSDIVENKQKSTPVDPIGITFSKLPIFRGPLANCLDPIILQTLEGYVLPLLPKEPLFIHNLHFKIKITQECYAELDLSKYRRNAGKFTSRIIGNTAVDYVFYANGTVDIHTECSRHPFKLQTEEDRSRLLVFFGQLRGNLVNFLKDPHERLIPDIMEWQITECDINKDVKVSDFFHFSAIKVQVRHLDHLFIIYIKSMGKDTVCRVEERKHPAKKPAIELINDIFSPLDRFESRLAEQDSKLNEINDKLTRLANNNSRTIAEGSQQISEGVADM